MRILFGVCALAVAVFTIKIIAAAVSACLTVLMTDDLSAKFVEQIV
jgi:hypothetical protein